MSKRKTAREKLETKKDVYFDTVEPKKGMGNLHGKMVIPPGSEYEDVMRKVPYGSLLTVDAMRDHFARKYDADFCCPLVSGIFTNLVAQAAEEDMADRGMSISEIVPYWRTLKTGGELNSKYPGGVEAQAEKLTAEGHEIEMSRSGKPKRITDFEKKVIVL